MIERFCVTPQSEIVKSTARQNHLTQKEGRELGAGTESGLLKLTRYQTDMVRARFLRRARDNSLSPLQNWRLQLKAGVRVGKRCRALLDRMLG